MNRTEFQRLAEVRLREAEALLAAGLWDGAYYLAGYAVECGLKACIFARIEREGVVFEEKKFGEQCWTHNLADLLRLAGLDVDLDASAPLGSRFAVNWAMVRGWSEVARYRRWTDTQATAYLDALNDPNAGVVPWLRMRW